MKLIEIADYAANEIVGMILVLEECKLNLRKRGSKTKEHNIASNTNSVPALLLKECVITFKKNDDAFKILEAIPPG